MNHQELIPRQTNEASVVRYTSEHVLTVGVAQGWADPEDPRLVDFSSPHSCLGPLEFDDEGYALNPRRTSGMQGGRGELGKHGVNNATESLVVAVDDKGTRRILLTKRADTGQWSLPGGMVDGGERVSAAAKRELREETAIDLSEVPYLPLYEWYANDPRNTLNAWIETMGSLQIIHHTPEPTADGKETLAAKWFDLPPTLAELKQEVGELYASHGEGIQILIAHLRTYDDKMNDAQMLYSKGHYQEAQQAWQEARDLMPDPLEKGRAVRGDAESAERLGQIAYATAQAEEALALHNLAFQTMPEEAQGKALREQSASIIFIGKIVARQAIRAERAGEKTPAQTREVARQVTERFTAALQDIRRANPTPEIPDQYEINLLSRLAMVHSLGDQPTAAKAFANLSIVLGWQSETKRRSTSASISGDYSRRAKKRAVLRGCAAVVVSHVITQRPGLRRKAALAVTDDRRLGI